MLWGSHFTGLFEASLRSDGVHAIEHLAYLVTAVLFWMPVVGRDPAPSGLSYPARILYLFFAMASMAFLGLALFSADRVLYPTYAAVEGAAKAIADQRMGGAIMWVGGMIHIVPALALVMLAWMRADERAARRIDAQLLRVADLRGDRRRAGTMSVSVSRAMRASRAVATVADYVALTKPRVVSLLVVTGVCGYLAGAAGHVQIAVLLAVAGGGALAAGGANALNCAFDRDLDATDDAHALRPIPGGRVPILHAVVLGIAMNAAAALWLGRSANLLAAALALGGTAWYLVVYTAWLKRRSTQNIVIGGAAGCFPPLVGWAAATGTLDATALTLAAVIFLWTPPHFWALATLLRDDYRRAGIPMLPAVVSVQRTANQAFVYAVATVAVSLSPMMWGGASGVYTVSAAGLGAVFVWRSEAFRHDADRAQRRPALPLLARLPGRAVRGARGGSDARPMNVARGRHYMMKGTRDRYDRCIRCHDRVPWGESVCRSCNPARLPSPSPTQYHATVFLVIIVTLLAVAGWLMIRA